LLRLLHFAPFRDVPAMIELGQLKRSLKDLEDRLAGLRGFL
jgi:hypothetical protein